MQWPPSWVDAAAGGTKGAKPCGWGTYVVHQPNDDPGRTDHPRRLRLVDVSKGRCQDSRRRILNEEEPFKCLGCGKPFTTQSMIEKMEEKLAGHRMFEGDGMRRLKLCEDCRVKDMFKEKS